jgi:hypothetical protein
MAAPLRSLFVLALPAALIAGGGAAAPDPAMARSAGGREDSEGRGALQLESAFHTSTISAR